LQSTATSRTTKESKSHQTSSIASSTSDKGSDTGKKIPANASSYDKPASQ
jgi:hypothetical protein